MPPAARISDMHTCPMVTGTVPHVGGPIAKGFLKVMIGFMPAARVGDTAICVGPPDAIAMGSPTVFIGNMMAARMGDPTTHGGVVSMGLPTVIIGDMGMGAAGSAQGKAMIAAKQKAKPFCEECEKAKKELERLEKEENLEPHSKDGEEDE